MFAKIFRSPARNRNCLRKTRRSRKVFFFFLFSFQSIAIFGLIAFFKIDVRLEELYQVGNVAIVAISF